MGVDESNSQQPLQGETNTAIKPRYSPHPYSVQEETSTKIDPNLMKYFYIFVFEKLPTRLLIKCFAGTLLSVITAQPLLVFSYKSIL